jgi:arylsulfatase
MEIDWSVGVVMNALKRTGLEKDTLVIFASDNGPWLCYGDHAGSADPLREGKGTNWEGGTRVPCLMVWPGQIPAGKTNDNMIMTIDLLPTIGHIVGADLPRHKIDGLDIWPLLSEKKGARNPHDAYFFYYEQNSLQAVTTGDGQWKLQLPHIYRTLAGKPGGKGGKPVKYSEGRIAAAELYDLRADISEANDVSAQNPKMVEHLLKLAESARADLGDALTGRQGAGVRPPGKVPAK